MVEEGAREGDGERRVKRTGRHSVRRINALAAAIGAKTYLEIGVSRGDTFFSIDVPRKIAVDPDFQFDWQAEQKENVVFNQVTSDEWFLKCDVSRKFDLIFLDGLHTFEQTFRDFCNSLAVAHDRTVWLIDDVVPTDPYSAWPERLEAVRLRKKTFGLDVRGWQGDVFKVVFMIHDFFPMMSFRTINSNGNPQTLVWKAPRSNFKPLFNSAEAVSRLTFFDFQRHFDVMHPGTEQEIMAAFTSSYDAGGLGKIHND